MYTPNPTRVQEALKRANGVFASILDTKLVSPEVAKVVVSLSTNDTSPENVCASISNALSNNFSPILQSFRAIPNGRTPTYVGFVAASREVAFADSEKFRSLRPLTAGIMLDPTDESVWSIHSNEQGTFVVREGSEDMSRTLETARVRDLSAPTLASLSGEVVVGDYVTFVDIASGDLKRGFMVAASAEDQTLDVVTDEEEAPVTIDAETVVEAVGFDEEDEAKMAETAGVDKANFGDSIPSQTEYYKQLFSYAPEYLEKVNAIIDGRASF